MLVDGWVGHKCLQSQNTEGWRPLADYMTLNPSFACSCTNQVPHPIPCLMQDGTRQKKFPLHILGGRHSLDDCFPEAILGHSTLRVFPKSKLVLRLIEINGNKVVYRLIMPFDLFDRIPDSI